MSGFQYGRVPIKLYLQSGRLDLACGCSVSTPALDHTLLLDGKITDTSFLFYSSKMNRPYHQSCWLYNVHLFLMEQVSWALSEGKIPFWRYAGFFFRKCVNVSDKWINNILIRGLKPAPCLYFSKDYYNWGSWAPCLLQLNSGESKSQNHGNLTFR